MKVYKVGILGGGIAGLACAYHLKQNGEDDFFVLTKDIGGRIESSKDGRVNYGAYWIRADYKHISKFIKTKSEISAKNISIITGNKTVSIANYVKNNFWLLLKLLIPIIRFKFKFSWLRRQAEVRSQKEIIESDPYLSGLYNESAGSFLKDYGVEKLLPVVTAMARFNGFINPVDASAFLCLDFALGLFYKMYEFEFQIDKLTRNFRRNIILDEVTQVEKRNEYWVLKTREKEFYCKNLISALPINQSNELLSLNLKTNKSIGAHVFHVNGSLKPEYEANRYIAFEQGDEMGILKQTDNSFILYSSNEHPDMDKYFSDYSLIFKKHWDPALFMGRTLVESNQKNNLFLIGDYNIPGLEDAFITGIYAANRIINNK